MFSNIPPIKNISDIEKIEEIALSKHMSFESTYQLLEYSAEQYENQLALRFTAQGISNKPSLDLSYRNLFKKVTQTANLFHSLGLGTNETISFILPNILQTHYCISGGETAGIVNAINPFLDAHTIAHILNEVECKILVTTVGDETWQKVCKIIGNISSLKCVLHIDLCQFDLPQTQKFQANDNLLDSNNIKVLDFDKELVKHSDEHLSFNRHIKGSDIAAYFHTGGTTGKPKIAMHSHYNQVCNAWMISALINNNQQTKPDVILSGLPLFHVNAIIVTGIGAFIRGATVVLIGIQGYRTKTIIPDFWKIVAHFKASTFSCVPTILNALMKIPIRDANIDSLQYAICGAAPLSPNLFKAFENYSKIKVLEGYGLTESVCLASLNPLFGEKKIGSVGLRIPYEEIKVIKLDQNGDIIKRCNVDEVGTLFIKGPHIFPGYKQHNQNKQVFDDAGWLNTGDLAKIDEQNYIWLTGRAKDLIIRSGHNIDPAIIEEVLMSHPAVDAAAAIGQPDLYSGELPCAFVTIKEPIDSKTLLIFAQNNISERAAAPVHIEIISQLPLTAVGKIFKPDLRKIAIRRVFENALTSADIQTSLLVTNNEDSKLEIKIYTTEPKSVIDKIMGDFSLPYQVCTPTKVDN